MGYEVRPVEVGVPADDPFQNDCLDRRQTAKALSRFIGTVNGSCVVSLDAEWGMKGTPLPIVARLPGHGQTTMTLVLHPLRRPRDRDCR